jgi:CheY-like chemotaxis protein
LRPGSERDGLASVSAERPIVLLVDDNADILETTSRFLRARGLDVIAVDSALSVAALVVRHQPQIVVLDVMMPALDGDVVAKLVASQPGIRSTPIVFYSAMEEEQLYALVRCMPGTSCVSKSDGLEALHSTILGTLGGKTHEGSSGNRA